MTTPGSVRRLVVATTIGSFSLAALMGVLALIGSGDVGETEARVLLTTLVVGATSVAVLCYLATGETPYQPVGVAGGLVVLVPLLTSLWLIWLEDVDSGSEAVWKAFGIGVVVAATLAQASLLLALAGPRPSLRPLLLATLALATVLAVLVSAVILGAYDDGGLWRAIGVVAILDVLGTVVAMALAVLGGARAVGHDHDDDRDRATRPVELPAALVVGLDERARVTGRPRAELLAEAVADYLAR